MEFKEFITNFAEQFDEVNLEELTTETKFRELDEWSSIVALGIIGMVDEEYNVMLDSADMKSAETIGELYELVKSKK